MYQYGTIILSRKRNKWFLFLALYKQACVRDGITIVHTKAMDKKVTSK